MARAHDSKIPRGLYLYPDGKWGVEYRTPEGKRRRRKIGLKSEAVAYYAEITRRKAVGGVLPERKATTRLTLAHYLAEYAATARNHVGKLYAETWSKMIGHLYPEQLSTQQLREWIVRSENAGLKPATIARYLSVLSPVYTRLVEELGVIAVHQNPLRNKRKLGMRPLNNERIRTMDPAQLPALVEAYGPTWWPYIEFMMLNLLRFGNLASLEWTDIDWDRNIAMLATTKHGEKHALQLSERSMNILHEMRQRQRKVESKYCFPAERGGKLSRHNFRKRVWLPAHEAAGLVDVHLHDLGRHIPAGWLAELGKSNYELSKSLQQKTQRMVKRYAHLRDPHMRGIMEDVASVMGTGFPGPERRVNGESTSGWGGTTFVVKGPG